MVLFGAGHVGRAVVLALAPLPFAVHWIDIEAGSISAARAGATWRPSIGEHPAQVLARAPGDAFIIVMTHSHPLDFDITAAALQRETFEFVGLIGRRPSCARFASFARQVGVTASQLNRLVCPIGIAEIKGKEPAIIAAALAAQLLVVRDHASTPQVSPATQPA